MSVNIKVTEQGCIDKRLPKGRTAASAHSLVSPCCRCVGELAYFAMPPMHLSGAQHHRWPVSPVVAPPPPPPPPHGPASAFFREAGSATMAVVEVAPTIRNQKSNKDASLDWKKIGIQSNIKGRHNITDQTKEKELKPPWTNRQHRPSKARPTRTCCFHAPSLTDNYYLTMDKLELKICLANYSQTI